MAKPKHDYDSDDFYKLLESLAMNGYTDEEIANHINLAGEVFCRMKNGSYNGWSDEENSRRGSRIYQVLVHGRTEINARVRAAYLKGAFGGKMVRSKIVKYVQEKCECMGRDKKCSYCGGTGWITLTDKAVIQEGETELPPNMQALTTWMYHHDPEWRKVERKLDEEASDIPVDINKGVDIDAWIKKEVSGD